MLVWISSNGKSDEDDKFFPALARHVDKNSGLIATSLLGTPSINSGSTTVEQMYVCYEVREAFSLYWDYCVTFSSDNTNSMTGQRNSLLQKIRRAQGNQKIFDVGFSGH